MKKKKFDLTSDLITIDDGETSITQDKQDMKGESSKMVLLTMSIEEELRAEFKCWCAKHRLKMSQAFIKSFQLLKERYSK